MTKHWWPTPLVQHLAAENMTTLRDLQRQTIGEIRDLQEKLTTLEDEAAQVDNIIARLEAAT